jgi:hypothetical protein
VRLQNLDTPSRSTFHLTASSRLLSTSNYPSIIGLPISHHFSHFPLACLQQTVRTAAVPDPRDTSRPTSHKARHIFICSTAGYSDLITSSPVELEIQSYADGHQTNSKFSLHITCTTALCQSNHNISYAECISYFLTRSTYPIQSFQSCA